MNNRLKRTSMYEYEMEAYDEIKNYLRYQSEWCELNKGLYQSDEYPSIECIDVTSYPVMIYEVGDSNGIAVKDGAELKYEIAESKRLQ